MSRLSRTPVLNSVQREHIRQPLADQTMLRDIQQTEIGAASNQFTSQFDAYINDPNTTAMVNGEMRTLNSLNDQELTQWLTSAAAGSDRCLWDHR